ncbi:MAG: hypothetical protein GXO75_18170 [Calditrichaeota bacterium]|nr:hypothetical protein [Calditrichota bacterium]
MSKFIVRIFFLIFFLTSYAFAQDDGMTLAISDFENNTNVFSHEMLGKTIPEMLKTELAQLGDITVLERSKINAVLSEQALGQTGIVDPQAAQKVGKLLGAEFVLTGELSTAGNRFRIDTHIVRVETGQVFAEKVTGPNEKAIEKMVHVLANNINFNLTGHGERKTRANVKNYFAAGVMGAGIGSAVLTIVFHSAYRKNYQKYGDAQKLAEFDHYYDKANRSYKARNFMLSTTAVLVTTGIVLWLEGKSENNKVFARNQEIRDVRFAVQPFYNDIPRAFGLQVTLSR